MPKVEVKVGEVEVWEEVVEGNINLGEGKASSAFHAKHGMKEEMRKTANVTG